MTTPDMRAVNCALDAQLLSLADALDVSRLHELQTRPDGEEAWSAAMLLGHLAEFPHFFAHELRRFLTDPSQPIGRTHEHPERLAAIATAEGKSLADLRAAVAAAFADLSEALQGIEDGHLRATTNNRKYGDEPLTEFLDRYVIGHKRSHLQQLAEMPASPQEST